jgi:hypothetical protein
MLRRERERGGEGERERGRERRRGGGENVDFRGKSLVKENG